MSEVSVDVVDVNDEIPTFSQNYQGSIRENSPPGTTVTIVSNSFVCFFNSSFIESNWMKESS